MRGLERLLVFAAGAVLSGGSAIAAELVGATAEVNRSVAQDDFGLSGPGMRGQAEIEFSTLFSTQIDLGYAGDDMFGDAVTGAVHGIYRPSSMVALGAFVGHDDVAGQAGVVYGLEGGIELSPEISAEAYLGGFDATDDTALLFGLQLTQDLGRGLNGRAGLDHAQADATGDLTRLNLGFDYEVTDRSGLYAEAGSVGADIFGLDAGDTYIGAGIKLDFGARGRAGFGRRWGLDLLSGR